ncbi:MAG: hypothetical protein JWM05_3097 [Acidimicrobiales bacterium]|nr:hypothetical protein [Acidimicrobiales bacterium]
MIVAASSWGYVTAAYVLVFLTLIAYVVRTVVLGRRVGRNLPPGDRRWM